MCARVGVCACTFLLISLDVYRNREEQAKGTSPPKHLRLQCLCVPSHVDMGWKAPGVRGGGRKVKKGGKNDDGHAWGEGEGKFSLHADCEHLVHTRTHICARACGYTVSALGLHLSIITTPAMRQI